MQTILTENSESQDGDSQEKASTSNGVSFNINPSTSTSSGYYDAEKCRAHIAKQIKVSKIDRFAAQIGQAIDVETGLHSRLCNILNMFVKCSAKVTNEFTLRCKLGLQRHRQDRILNQSKRKSSKKTDSRLNNHVNEQYTISNDLLYGEGAQLILELLSQPMTCMPSKHIRASSTTEEVILDEDDYMNTDSFEPQLFVKKLESSIRNNLRRSRSITTQLNKIKQLFERLALEHRDKVDIVYAAEEERQATIVTRRSAYNLSVAAIKATTTPIHVNSTSNEIF